MDAHAQRFVHLDGPLVEGMIMILPFSLGNYKALEASGASAIS